MTNFGQILPAFLCFNCPSDKEADIVGVITLLMLAYAGSVPVFSEPTPLPPGNIRIAGETILAGDGRWSCRITPLNNLAVDRYLKSMGMTGDVLNRLTVGLSRLAVFQMEWTNTGEDNLWFNPDQVALRGKRGMEGAVVDMARFWPASVPMGGEEQKRLASVFSRSSVELAPGERHIMLLAFHPTGKRFARRVDLRVERFYYGIESLIIACRFKVRYTE